MGVEPFDALAQLGVRPLGSDDMAQGGGDR
jgi:hypothetical protein